MALQSGSGSLAHLQHQAHGLFVHGVVLFARGIAGGLGFFFVGRSDEERLVVLGRGLRLPEIDHAVDFGFGDEGAMDAGEARRAGRQEEHVALAQQVLGAHHVEDGAGIDAGGDAEADAGGIPLNVNKVKPHPKEGYVGSEYDGTEAAIGACVTVPKGYFYVYAYWRPNDKGHGELCSAIASVGCYSVGAAESLYRALHQSKGAFKVDPYEVYAEKLLDPEDFGTLESHFDTLIEQWIAHTKVIGDLKKYLK